MSLKHQYPALISYDLVFKNVHNTSQNLNNLSIQKPYIWLYVCSLQTALNK